jgi:lipopolysaccharide/colanic/teichoic acid biosynthesis glycosyltransferase
MDNTAAVPTDPAVPASSLPMDETEDIRAARLVGPYGDFARKLADSVAKRQVEIAALEQAAVKVRNKPFNLYKTKRLCDVVAASVVFLLGLPFAIILALLIKLESAGPVLYPQTRTGIDRRRSYENSLKHQNKRTFDACGKPFRLYKFRSMSVNAETGTGPVWAPSKDPRVTRVGYWLRKLHLDEYPQLWNVIRGEMSLVGPRPERPEFAEILGSFIPCYRVRYICRPGIFGLAQIEQGYDREPGDVIDKLKYDFIYLENASFFYDLKIMVRTIWMTFKPGHNKAKGA